jgi:hypothetical protein
MRDTLITYGIQLNHPPAAVIGSDSPRCRALIESLRDLNLPGVGYFTAKGPNLRRHDVPDPVIEHDLRENFRGDPALHLLLVDGKLSPELPEPALLTIAVRLDEAPLHSGPGLRCDLAIRHDGDTRDLRVLLHGLYQLLFEQGPICVDVADVLAVMERAERGVFVVGRGADVATAARAARRELARRGFDLRRACGLLTLIRSDKRLRLDEILVSVDELSGELPDDVPHAFSHRLIEGKEIEVLLLVCDAF